MNHIRARHQLRDLMSREERMESLKPDNDYIETAALTIGLATFIYALGSIVLLLCQ